MFRARLRNALVPYWSIILIALSLAGAIRSQEIAPAPPPASARELLATYGIGPAEFARFSEGRSITPDEEAVLAKILLRFSRLGLDNIHRWRMVDPDWNAVAAATHQVQGELLALRGRARRVTEHKLPQDLAQQMEFARYYSVEIDLDGAARRAVVYTRVVPRAWKIGTPIDEPATADGLLLKLGPPPANQAGDEPLLFVAGRIGWLPDSSPLGRAGFDVSLFDAVRETNGEGLVAADREPFYQLLAAIGRVEKPRQAPPLDLVALLQHPADHHGEAYAVRGTARRIVKVLIGETGLRERLGFDHYYEIDLFVPLGEARIRFDDANGAPDSPVFENTYPVTLVTRQLPAGVAPGENLHEAIAADAVFFKLWTYESRYMAKRGRVQPAPLLVANVPRLVPAATPEAGPWGTMMTVLLVGMLLAILAAWWWFERGDRTRVPSSTMRETTRG